MRLPDCVLEEMAKDSRLSVVERGLYLLSWAHDPPTIKDLARIANMNRNIAARACRNLAKWDWMKLVDEGRCLRPASVIPHACQVIMAHDLENEYDLTPNKGEYLAGRRVDWWLRRGDYLANARPKFLKNPSTDKPMEYDTLDIKVRFATEYNGSQHYKETEKYKDEQVKELMAHDLMKESLSLRHNIVLLSFTWRDLRPGVLEKRLDAAVPHLKRGYVDRDGPYIKVLNRICDNYASRVERAEIEAERKAQEKAKQQMQQQGQQQAPHR